MRSNRRIRDVRPPRSFAPHVADLRGAGEVLAFVAPDAGAAWRIELSADGYAWAHHDGPPGDADATVTADDAQLLLGLYGRPADLVDRWRRSSAL